MPTATPPSMPPPEAITFPWWADLLAFSPILLCLLFLAWYWRQAKSSAGFLKKQTDYLDHQRSVNERGLEQSKSFEELISRQYAETNSRSDQALAQSAEAIRLHAAALAQLTAMNEALSKLASKLETGTPGNIR